VVYNKPMRPSLTMLLALSTLSAHATRPDLAVVFVYDTKGSPMPGAYATPIAAQAWLSKPNAPAWTVEMHFTVSKDYPYSPHEIGRQQSWPLNADTVRNGRQRHLRFNILDCWCKDQYLLAIQGGDTMRVDMPNDANVRGHLIHHMVVRSGAVPSPEAIRFRPGRFRFEALAQDAAMHEVEQRIARALMSEAQKRDPMAARKARPVGPHPQALQSPQRPIVMREVKLVELLGDTAVLRFWGNVMLTGACGGIMPLMAIEVELNGRWEDFVPMPVDQLDCGPLSEEGRGHELHIPLGEWIHAHGRSMTTGNYRLRFIFADGAPRWTKAFRLG
jgi:hypothetical protein